VVKTVIRHVGLWARMLHIYASMAGFVLVLLFAVTGVTLNHQDLGWGEPEASTSTLSLPADVVKADDPAVIAGRLQQALGITTPVSAFEAYDDEITVQFHAPGHRVQAIVDRATGDVRVMRESRGSLGVLNDLHKGMETGVAWKWIVDFTAVLIGFSALTGLMTLVTLPKRRRVGLLTTAAGTVAVLALYWFAVPR
jgi:hypothetical protein